MMHSLVLNASQVERIERILDELLAKTRSTFVMLADISGQLIQVRGRTGSTDCIALAALFASNMAATAEMARRIGEERGFRLLFHEGDHENIYLSHVGHSFLLAVTFSSGVQIGLVRLFSKRAVEELTTLTSEYETAVSQVPSIMEGDFQAELDDELDRLMPGKL
jgi:predicted regulator of Ras-like GTPase activity (Roadblock/LC7/MglB family)